MSERSYKVHVTGFTAYEGFDVNISWEICKELWNLEWPKNIELITTELPLIYKAIDEELPDLIQKYQPDLIVHLGEHEEAIESILIEKKAYNGGYKQADYYCNLPSNNLCRLNAKPFLETAYNVNDLCNLVNEACEKSELSAKCTESTHPGCYLNGYLYFTSLFVNNCKSILVHLPPNGIYNMDDMAQVVQNFILALLKQL